MIKFRDNLLKLCDTYNKDFTDSVVTFGLGGILVEDVKGLNKQLAQEIEISFVEQKIQNYFFQIAYNEISTLLTEINARVIFIKGLTLAADLYNYIEMRQSSDIDVIIDKKDIKDILEILGENGWCLLDTGEVLSGETFSKKDIDTILARMCHLSEIKKEFILPSGIGRSVEVDLHIRIYNDFNCESFYMEAIKKRSISKEVLGLSVLQLDLHDKILHLLCSFTKEHIDTLGKYVLLGNLKKHIVKVNLLYDIALLIDKYCEQIDWSIIISRVRELEKEGELLFAIRMFSFVFPELIPEYMQTILEDRLHKLFTCELTDGLKRRSIPYLVTVKPEDFFTKNLSIIYEQCLESLEWVGPEISIHHECKELPAKYEIKEEGPVYNRFNSVFKFNSEKYSMNDEQFIYALAYCEQGIIVEVQKRYSMQEAKCLEKEHFWITVGGKEKEEQGIVPFTMKRFEFILDNANTVQCLDGVPSGGTIYNIRTSPNNQFVIRNINRSEQEYYIKVLLPWEMVRLHYNTCSEFWFDFEGEISNGDLVCFANPRRVMFDDPSLLCRVKLVK